MKILQINSVCGIRSTGKICADIADILTEQGHECKIACGRENVPEQYGKYAVRIGNAHDVRLHALRSRLFDSSGFGGKKATKKFIEWIKAYDPDIIHLHNIHGYYINIEVLFNYLAEIEKPVVWTLHDCWAFTGHCAHFSFIECEKWKTGCFKCPQKTSYPASYLFNRSKRNWVAKKELFTGKKDMFIVTPSHWLGEIAKRSFLGKHQIQTIHNGINLNIFKPDSSDFHEKYGLTDKFVILGVALYWGKRKGLDVFIDLADALDDKYQIVLVGTDDKIDKKLPEKIISIHKTQNQTELAQIYTAADVFVNPTREEVLGMVNIESLSCGTPIVTFRTGGSPECIDENCGSVVECNNIDAMKKEIVRVCETRPFSQAACIDQSKDFDMNSKYIEYIKQYKRLLK